MVWRFALSSSKQIKTNFPNEVFLDQVHGEQLHFNSPHYPYISPASSREPSMVSTALLVTLPPSQVSVNTKFIGISWSRQHWALLSEFIWLNKAWNVPSSRAFPGAGILLGKCTQLNKAWDVGWVSRASRWDVGREKTPIRRPDHLANPSLQGHAVCDNVQWPNFLNTMV